MANKLERNYFSSNPTRLAIMRQPNKAKLDKIYHN